MSWRTESNPYNGLGLTQLAEACRTRVADLSEPRSRSPDERRVMASDTTALLIVLAKLIEPGIYTPANPEDMLRRESTRYRLSDEFSRWHQREMVRAARAVRQRTLTRAADWVLGGKAALWIDPGCGPLNARPGYRALESDEGLFAVLAELQVMQSQTL